MCRKQKPKRRYTSPLTEEYKSRRLPSGVYAIQGPQGAGKTSLMMALISHDWKYHSQERMALAQAEIDALNSINQAEPYKLKLPPCMYRTRSKLFLPNGKPTYHTDISQFGLPSAEHPEVQHFPPFTVIGCDEADSYMDCREWQKNANYIIDGMKYIRHQDLVLILDVQNFEKLDKHIRRLTTDNIYVKGKRDIYENVGKRIKRRVLVATEWTLLWVKQQEFEHAQKLGMDTKPYIQECKFVYEGNIYKNYNSQSGKPFWYANIEQFEVQEHPSNSLSRDSVSNFIKNNALRKSKPEDDDPGDKE